MSGDEWNYVEGWRPSKVFISDFVDGELSSDPEKEIDTDTKRVEVLVRRDGRAAGMVKLDLDDGGPTLADQLVAAAARLPASADAPWSRFEPTSWPRVTVAIPTTFGGVQSLSVAVASIAQLDYPEFEIVLVDNRPVPNEEDHAQVRSATGHDVQILHESERGISAARNRALRDCENQFIAFTDDDVEVEPDWLQQLVRPLLSDPRVACSSGIIIPAELTSPEQSMFEDLFGGFNRSFVPVLHGDEGAERDPLFPYGAGKFGSGANIAFRTSVLKEIGGFDNALGTGTPARGGEELAAFIQILSDGGLIAFEPSAILHHMHRGTSGELRHQVFSYGLGLTAMFTSLLVADKRHRRGIARKLPIAAKLFLSSGNGTVRKNEATSVPLRLRLWHAAGMASGPPKYFVSRRRHPARVR
jgi:GT2 family glycosyltransferase